MSIAPGWTVDDVREFVYEYERQPYGLKSVLMAERGVSGHRLRRWRAAVFDGDLDMGLVPREGGVMTSVSQRRSTARAEVGRGAEIERLQARISELEQANDVLGKAIGLLHARNVEEPDESRRDKAHKSS